MSKAHEARSRWIQVISRQRSGDLGVAEFCRREGVAVSSFYAWRRRLGPGAQSPAHSGRPPFVEITTALRAGLAGDDGGVEVHLGNGLRIGVGRNFDQETLCRVVLALEKMPEKGVSA